ncbi:MAG: hypothetical protein ACREKL_03795 [Chthoniobacterales bacterium]
MSPAFEDTAEREIRDYVLTRANLGIYDPTQPKRPRVPVASFDIELLEFDEETSIAHAAGPVVLRGADGDVSQFLRVSVTVDPDGRIVEGSEFRAAYIVETNPENGACKETAALANTP